MFKVKNNAITITRGDSGIAEITLQTADGEEYTPQEGDSIRFALKSNRFTPRMTEFLDLEPLIDCFQHVAWIDNQGQTYYNALYNALYPDQS